MDIFEMIVLSSIIGSVIVLMILILKTLFKNSLNSSFHYYIWLILIIKLILPFGPQTPFNISNVYENFYVQSSTNENTQKKQIYTSIQIENTDLEDSISISDFQSSNKNIINNTINIPLKTKVSFENSFCFVWLFGVVLLIVIFIASCKKLRKIIRSSIKNINCSHKEILHSCMETMNIRKKVELSYSEKIGSPSLCGFIKPKILIPSSVAINIGDEEFKYIIMHELTHLKNKDILINWVITLLSIIYWFNPILLYGFHKMKQDCEISCDGKVISYLDEGENVQYGNSIIRVLELAKLNGISKRLTGTTSMVFNSSEIKRRIIMISKYKKLNLKSILLGTILVIFISVIGVALNTSNVSSAKNNVKDTASQSETPVEASKSTDIQSSNGTTTSNVKSSQTDNSTSITPISSDIVIYNSHADEDYPSGMKVTDVGALLNDKLVKEGLNSHFIKCDPPIEYIKSYQATRDLITKNVKEYSNTILLDVHRDVTEKTNSDTRKILFVLAKKSPHYEANKKFIDSLLENIKTSNRVESEVFFYETGVSYFNQDLSKNSTLIEIGNNMSSDSDIEDCVNALVSALKSIQKVTSN
ncbi:hypothetical protein SH2C18_07020 [Clostridium sediminicola]|uniref:M56 family metallopeptidase n=1 Tax=Clostridium sediminicola TaxID=3114879 RepID=UPI0031F21C15